MKIVSIEAVPLEAPFAAIFGGADKVPPQLYRPASHFQKIVRSGQFATLVFVHCEDGTVGVGEAFGLPDPVANASLVSRVIAPGLVGQEIGDPWEMLAEYRAYFAAMGHGRGQASEAVSAVDIALWDLKAKLAGQPLCVLLGGTTGPLPLYVSPVPFLPSTEESARAAQGFVQQGYHAIKLKIGRGVGTDLAHIGAVREAVGPDIGIMLDVNCAYDEDTAIELGRQLGRFPVTWYEEPIPPGDPAALARVRGRSAVPIATGENEFALGDFRALIAAKATDFLMPNIARAGGVSGMMRIGAMCADAGIGLSPHGVGSCVAVAAALHTCRAAPGFAFYEANKLLNPLRDEMPVEPLRLVDGAFLAPGTVGHGGDPRPELVETYRIDRSPRRERVA